MKFDNYITMLYICNIKQQTVFDKHGNVDGDEHKTLRCHFISPAKIGKISRPTKKN